MAHQLHTYGIKAFFESNRMDFLLEDPRINTEKPVARATVRFDSMDAEVKLDGKKLTILPAELDEDGKIKHPKRMSVRWGRQVLHFGLVTPQNGGKEFYYRSLETANDAARPKTAEELFAAMGLLGNG